jgi:hypothetical protein
MALDYEREPGAREDAICAAVVPPMMLGRTAILVVEAPFFGGIALVTLPLASARDDMASWSRTFSPMARDASDAFWGRAPECRR